MKVIDVYGKEGLNKLILDGKSLSMIMDNFFSKYPKKYRENYDRNIETLEIWRVDDNFFSTLNGEYMEYRNLIVFKNECSLIHELMHLSSYDSINDKTAFVKTNNQFIYEMALVEGMTEYLAVEALSNKPVEYFLELFTVSMLSEIDNIFEHYFIPNADKFINLFPNKKDIISLMYSLNFYFEKIDEFVDGKVLEEDYDDEIKRVGQSILNVIDSLIDIQLSFKKDDYENKIYAERFMDLISDDDLYSYLTDFNDKYLGYANREINKRILRRIR